MAEYTENGLSLHWDAAEVVAGPLPRTRRALVRLAPAHASNVVRGLYALHGGPEREVRGFPLGIDPGTGAQVFALDLPEPPAGDAFDWRPVASCGGRAADPRRMLPTAAPRSTPAPAAAPLATVGEDAGPERFDSAMDLLARVTVRLVQPPAVVGETPEGLRIVFAMAPGGTVRGPRLNGTLLQVGGDWMLVRRDGIGMPDARVLIRTAGGALVQGAYGGVVDFGPDGYRALAAGNWPARARVAFAPRFTSADPALAWLDRLQCVGIGRVTMASLIVEYDLLALRSCATEA